MRLGLDDSSEIFPVIEILNNYPLKKIIIHPRTAVQMYEGNINISVFIDALKQSVHKVVYNGDITHFTDIDYLHEKTGDLHGWMIGRGLLINPFLAEEIHAMKTTDNDEKIKRIKHFVDTLFNEYQYELQSPAHVLDKMHGVWSYLSQSFDNGRKIEKKIRKTLSIKHYADEVDRIFGSGVNLLNNHSILFYDSPRQN
jgi:tRNA-dihydrouridine synthase